MLQPTDFQWAVQTDVPALLPEKNNFKLFYTDRRNVCLIQLVYGTEHSDLGGLCCEGTSPKLFAVTYEIFAKVLNLFESIFHNL